MSTSNDPLWFKEAIIYQLHVKTFADGNNDGVGDFLGLTQKLDYLQKLGINTLWLLPFYASPLKDDGYDVSDYTKIHPSYGSLEDFKNFLEEAHRRKLKVITDFVLNHTSDQHEWFQLSRNTKPGEYWRDFYVWSDTPNKYANCKIMFNDFENSNWTWDSVANAYFWHRFYSHQPDLNYNNPEVLKKILEAADFWLEMGVDGVRLDAVQFLCERDGTDCEGLPETHAILKKIRAHIDNKYSNRILLSEVNQSVENTLPYFASGNECHMIFHFPLMPRLFLALQQENAAALTDIIEKTASIPDSCQWALFLRNHDELTLAPLNEKERCLMHEAYAKDPRARIFSGIRRRLAPLLENDRRKIELLHFLLFSLPGSPVIYYGDEIGMGDDLSLQDRHSVRTPMQWNKDKNAGFSTVDFEKLALPIITDSEYGFATVNVESQEKDSSSLLHWMKQLIAARQKFPSFGHGSIQFLNPLNDAALIFLRQFRDTTILAAANPSHLSHSQTIDIKKFKNGTFQRVFGKSVLEKRESTSVHMPPFDYGWWLWKGDEKL